MLATMQRLGIAASRSRPSVSNDNPFSESLFRTLKYLPELPLKPFEDILAGRRWVTDLVRWCSLEHRHSAIQFVTPQQRHAGLDKSMLKNREVVYAAARKSNPNRWSGSTRNWYPIDEVHLNPITAPRKEAATTLKAA
jgi:putative transposase